VRGDAQAAIAPLERALRLREAQPAAPLELAETRLWLARALWAVGGDRARAREVARAAAESCQGEARNDADHVCVDVAAWIAAHR
jgi:hypothetical protein